MKNIFKNILKDIGILVLGVLVLIIIVSCILGFASNFSDEHPFWTALIMLIVFIVSGALAGNIWNRFENKKIEKRKFLWGTISGVAAIIAVFSFCCFFGSGCQGCQDFKFFDDSSSVGPPPAGSWQYNEPQPHWVGRE
jgi:hypothetical protein